MSYTGAIVYVDGRIAPDVWRFDVTSPENVYGVVHARLMTPIREVAPNPENIRVHYYSNGLLLHILKPKGRTWSELEHVYERKRWPDTVWLELEEV